MLLNVVIYIADYYSASIMHKSNCKLKVKDKKISVIQKMCKKIRFPFYIGS